MSNPVQLRPARESEHFRTYLISDQKLWRKKIGEEALEQESERGGKYRKTMEQNETSGIRNCGDSDEKEQK